MRHLRLVKPASIANGQIKIQIVDTPKSLETRISVGFGAGWRQMNWTLLMFCI